MPVQALRRAHASQTNFRSNHPLHRRLAGVPPDKMPKWWVNDARLAAREVFESSRRPDAGAAADDSGYATAVDVLAELPHVYKARLEQLYVRHGAC